MAKINPKIIETAEKLMNIHSTADEVPWNGKTVKRHDFGDIMLIKDMQNRYIALFFESLGNEFVVDKAFEIFTVEEDEDTGLSDFYEVISDDLVEILLDFLKFRIKALHKLKI